MDDSSLSRLIDNRWNSSDTVWEVVRKTYEQNTRIYENRAEWVERIPKKRLKVQANRIFVNMEAVINSLIANPAQINVLPARKEKESQELSRKLEKYFKKKYQDLNVKEILRMGLRNLYFGRLLVLKPFWNAKINDFDVRAIDPRNVRFAKSARKEQDSEFAIEEIEDSLCAVMHRFKNKKQEILEKVGLKEDEAYIRNPSIKYKEAWIGDYVIFKYDTIILDKIKNPYWDWDGLLVTDEEEKELDGMYGDQKRQRMMEIKLEQPQRQQSMQQPPMPEGVQEEEVEGDMLPPNEGHTEPISYKAYYFNYFDQPRKPYIFATIFNNENTPVGRTDMITLASSLQQALDKRKRDIDENCDLVNGIIKVDATVMDKSDAQQLRFEAKGIIWGKNVMAGVGREVGSPLPPMVFDDMQDSRSEIDNIMAASSAFRGEREGTETKGGRLALIEQSFLRLNELVQMVDFVSGELFGWFYQLAKTRYTEYHYAKWMGREETVEVLDLIQDDFENGSEIIIIPGKSIPQDTAFRYQQAQEDVKNGFIAPSDYLEISDYPNPKDLARNLVMWQQNPASVVGITPQEMPQPFKPGAEQANTEQQMSMEQQQMMADQQLQQQQMQQEQLQASYPQV